MNNPDKIKILYLITQSELGGAGRYVVDLVTHLGDGYEPIVAFGEQGERGELATLLKPTAAVYYALPHLKRSINPYHDLLAFFEIVSLIRRLKPDIVHLNSSKIPILGSLATTYVNFMMRRESMRNYENAEAMRKNSIRIYENANEENSNFVDSHRPSQFVDSHPLPICIVYTVHGWVFNEPLPAWLKTFYHYAEKLTARFKDTLICICRFDLETAKKMGIPADKLALVPNGRAPIRFPARADARSALSARLPAGFLSDDKPLIGTVGNLYRTKGFEFLLAALRIMKDKGSAARLVIIGEGDERPALEAQIARLSLGDNVLLAGRIDDAAALLPAFDLYVCSSVKEGLSYTIIEAMQAGRPIVATSVGGNGDLIEDKVSGLLVPPADPSALADAITSLLTDRPLASRLGEAACEKAMREFTLEKMV